MLLCTLSLALWTRGSIFKLKETRYNEDIFYNEKIFTKVLAQVAQRCGSCSIPGNIQDKIGWSSEKPDLVEDAATHFRGFGLDGFYKGLPP